MRVVLITLLFLEIFIAIPVAAADTQFHLQILPSTTPPLVDPVGGVGGGVGLGATTMITSGGASIPARLITVSASPFAWIDLSFGSNVLMHEQAGSQGEVRLLIPENWRIYPLEFKARDLLGQVITGPALSSELKDVYFPPTYQRLDLACDQERCFLKGRGVPGAKLAFWLHQNARRWLVASTVVAASGHWQVQFRPSISQGFDLQLTIEAWEGSTLRSTRTEELVMISTDSTFASRESMPASVVTSTLFQYRRRLVPFLQSPFYAFRTVMGTISVAVWMRHQKEEVTIRIPQEKSMAFVRAISSTTRILPMSTTGTVYLELEDHPWKTNIVKWCRWFWQWLFS